MHTSFKQKYVMVVSLLEKVQCSCISKWDEGEVKKLKYSGNQELMSAFKITGDSVATELGKKCVL